MNTNTVELTRLVKAGGCGSKLGPRQLREALEGLRTFTDPNILFGLGSGDDAGVYRIGPDLAIVQTADFFTPIVDDPYDFGAIAAANAISDCYALGAKPITALSLVTFPLNLGVHVLREILRGGADKAREAGMSIIGGHSVQDSEPKYGLAVTGLVNPQQMIMNSGAKVGDALILTKKIGTGILTNALRRSRSEKSSPEGALPPAPEVMNEAIESMKTLSRTASELMVQARAHACTDVTGFGLLTHLNNMAEASGVSMSIRYSAIPTFDGIEPLAISCTKGGGERNLDWMKEHVHLDPGLGDTALAVLSDPQTSGPLLIAIKASQAAEFLTQLHDSGCIAARIIGEVVQGRTGQITVQK